MVERERLQECFRRQSAPAAEQMMQVGRGNVRCARNDIDFGLGAPVSADMGDGATHDVVVRGRCRKRCDATEALCSCVSSHVHVHERYLGLSKRSDPPISGYLNTVLVGPRRASISALPRSFAKQAFFSV